MLTFVPELLRLCKNNTSLRCSCKYLCAFIHHVAPRHVFDALDMLDDVQSGIHLDRFNLQHSAGRAVPITQFSEGGLWVEDQAGTHLVRDGKVERFGYLRNFSFFDSHSRHAVMPWDGRRVVIAAHMPTGLDTADPSVRSHLSGLGFVLRVFPSPEPPPAILDPRSHPLQAEEPGFCA